MPSARLHREGDDEFPLVDESAMQRRQVSPSIAKYRENPLRDVNRLHFLLKAFLDRRRGFDRGGLAGWLDLFSVVVNPPSGAMAKAAAVLDRAMASPKTLRYREFYEKGCR